MNLDKKDTYRVLAIAGSLRQGSYNHQLLEVASNIAPDGLTIDVYNDLGSVPLFNEDLEGGLAGDPEGVQNLRKACEAADGLIFATPEYNQSMPGVIKNLVDWLSRGDPQSVLERKPVAILGITAGKWGTRLAQASLRQTLNATEALTMASPSVYLQSAGDIFADSATAHKELQPVLAPFLKEFHSWLGLTKPSGGNLNHAGNPEYLPPAVKTALSR